MTVNGKQAPKKADAQFVAGNDRIDVEAVVAAS